MNSIDDLLDERLARLAAGEPLESCLAGLPEDAVLLVKKAALLRAVAEIRPTANKVAAQRSELLRAARKDMSMPTQNRKPAIWLAGLTVSAAALFVCVLIASAIAGTTWLRRRSQPSDVAQNPTPQFPWGFITQITEPPLEPANPQTGVVRDANGVVEVQSAEGAWQAAKNGEAITAGQRVRTGALSSATLAFYDGSQARLGPNTEVSVDMLDAQKSGPRLILLTQWLGDSDHEVVSSSDSGSRYEIATPSGAGAAKGTKFHVFVSSTLLVRFDVDEGQVAVTSLSTTVLVIPGQSTVIVAGEAPSEPMYRLRGEGEVFQIGGTWHIGGEWLWTNSNTVLVGDPQVGDWVIFEGRYFPDGSRYADRIIFLRRVVRNQFAFTGKVEAIGATWTIGGKAIHVDALTRIEDGIRVGDTVAVAGAIATDGTLWASRITLIEVEEPGLPFQFSGVVESLADDVWVISGRSVSVDANTHIESGLAVGDIVAVKGRVLQDGSWLAESIERAEEDEREFEIAGQVASMDPWKVAGISFDVDGETEIDADIQVGDQVKVEGRILPDGMWLAEEISRPDDVEELRFEFVGKVSNLDPWVVGGVTLASDENTEVEGNIDMGDTVKVRGRILDDGTWLVEKIKLVRLHLGCADKFVVVRTVETGQIVLLNWEKVEVDGAVDVEGDVKVASIVILRVCVDEDGTTVVISIIVIHQLDELPVIIIRQPDNGGGHNDGDHDDDHDDDDDDD